MSHYRKIIVFLLAIGVISGVGLFFMNQSEKEVLPEKKLGYFIPEFSLTEFNSVSNPLSGTPFDFDEDGVEEIFIGGGESQDSVLMKYFEEGSQDVFEQTGLEKIDNVLASAVADIDRDEREDLIVLKKDGLFLYLREEGKLSENKIELNLAEGELPISVVPGDFDKDSFVDLHLVIGGTGVSKGRNILLFNNRDLTFEDLTEEAGILNYGNIKGVSLSDTHLDGIIDITLSIEDHGVKFFRNMGNRTFKEFTGSPLSGKFGGMAVADFDDNRTVDFVVANESGSPLFFKNKKNFTFEEISVSRGLDQYKNFSEALFYDFNLDGREDLIFTKNEAPLEGEQGIVLLLQDELGAFVEVTESAGLDKKLFGKPMVVDVNEDGYYDLFLIQENIGVKLLLNSGGDNPYIKVVMKNNNFYIGARVINAKPNGVEPEKQFVRGQGFGAGQTNQLIFGLTLEDEVKHVTTVFMSGQVNREDTPEHNAVIKPSLF